MTNAEIYEEWCRLRDEGYASSDAKAYITRQYCIEPEDVDDAVTWGLTQ